MKNFVFNFHHEIKILLFYIPSITCKYVNVNVYTVTKCDKNIYYKPPPQKKHKIKTIKVFTSTCNQLLVFYNLLRLIFFAKGACIFESKDKSHSFIVIVSLFWGFFSLFWGWEGVIFDL